MEGNRGVDMYQGSGGKAGREGDLMVEMARKGKEGTLGKATGEGRRSTGAGARQGRNGSSMSGNLQRVGTQANKGDHGGVGSAPRTHPNGVLDSLFTCSILSLSIYLFINITFYLSMLFFSYLCYVAQSIYSCFYLSICLSLSIYQSVSGYFSLSIYISF